MWLPCVGAFPEPLMFQEQFLCLESGIKTDHILKWYFHIGKVLQNISFEKQPSPCEENGSKLYLMLLCSSVNYKYTDDSTKTGIFTMFS